MLFQIRDYKGPDNINIFLLHSYFNMLVSIFVELGRGEEWSALRSKGCVQHMHGPRAMGGARTMYDDLWEAPPYRKMSKIANKPRLLLESTLITLCCRLSQEKFNHKHQLQHDVV